MNSPGGDGRRTAWSRQTDPPFDTDPAALEQQVRRRQAAIARRDRVANLSAAIIIPSWVAAIWYLPDLRWLGVIGLTIGVWVTWQRHLRSGARVAKNAVDLPCLQFQRELLRQELDFAASLPKWTLAPLGVCQVAMVAGMVTNPRFTGSQFYPEGVFLFIGTVMAAFFVIWRRWQREARQLQLELDVISAAARQ